MRKFTVIKIDYHDHFPSAEWVEAESYDEAATKKHEPGRAVVCVLEGLHHMWVPGDGDPDRETGPDEQERES